MDEISLYICWMYFFIYLVNYLVVHNFTEIHCFNGYIILESGSIYIYFLLLLLLFYLVDLFHHIQELR